jgi:NADPH:quinone reductase-like Zn-dependent oxidoreductase
VFDTIGGDVQNRSWKTLRAGGTLVSILSSPSTQLAEQYNSQAKFVFVQPDSNQLAELAKLIDAKLVKPIVGTVLPLTQVSQAHTLSQSRHTRGKIVLRVIEP